MTWTFPTAVTHGTYVNGDVWVYTATTLPMPTLSSPPTGSGSTARNGGMINPTFNTMVESGTYGLNVSTPMRQGYDGRTIDFVVEGVSDITVYDASYNAHVSAATLSPGDSLVSAHSISDADYAVFSSNHRSIDRMACLTVVNYIPETDEFRPAYFGTTKTRRRFSDLDTGLLPGLTAAFNPKGTSSSDFHIDTDSIRAAPGVEDLYITNEESMRAGGLYDLQYWIHPIIGNNIISLIKPYRQQYVYPRDTNAAQGRVSAYVMHDFADRDVFLVNLMQVAIDAFAVADGHSGRTPFATGAGFWGSPLWAIRLAGLLFDDADMLDVANMTTGVNDYNGDPFPKWGAQQRVYFSATGNPDYLLPAGYVGDVPLYGDRPVSDLSGGQGSNNTYQDFNGVYDGYTYRYGFSLGVIGATVAANSADGTTVKLDTNASAVDDAYNGYVIEVKLDGSKEHRVITDYVASTRIVTVSPAFSVAPDNNDTYSLYLGTYPNVLDDTYVDMQDVPILGSYAIMNNAQMGDFISSIVMGDEGYEGGAVADYNRRWANDRQMWLNWGVNFDYSTSDVDLAFQRDIQGFGGTGNGWMADLWDSIDTAPSATTIFSATLTSNDAGWGGYTQRQGVVITGGAGASNEICVTFEADSGQQLDIAHASIGISVDSDFTGHFEDCTATPVELTFNGGSHGVSISAGQSKASDWVSLGGFTSANILNVTIDYGGSNANPRRLHPAGGAGALAYKAGSASYNSQNLTQDGYQADIYVVNKIEVR